MLSDKERLLQAELNIANIDKVIIELHDFIKIMRNELPSLKIARSIVMYCAGSMCCSTIALACFVVVNFR